jgi:hypothetical protein
MNDLDSLFRDAGRISPDPELWRRIAERSSLAPGAERGRAPGDGRSERGGGRQAGAGSDPEAEGWRGEGTGSWWPELRYLRAAGVVLAAGLLTLAAIGVLRRPHGELVREASAEQAGERTADAAQGDPQVFDPELLGWQADLGDYELVADQAEEVL